MVYFCYFLLEEYDVAYIIIAHNFESAYFSELAYCLLKYIFSKARALGIILFYVLAPRALKLNTNVQQVGILIFIFLFHCCYVTAISLMNYNCTMYLANFISQGLDIKPAMLKENTFPNFLLLELRFINIHTRIVGGQ